LTTTPLSSLKVFLSHTNEFNKYPNLSNDKTYIARAKEAVEKFDHKCVEMEAFTADPTTPQDYDERMVKECDVYIGIIGMRYGSLTSEGISHTEHEYNTALKENKKILMFILDDKSIESKLPIEELTSGEMHKNQNAFKNRVKINHLVKFFLGPEHLYNQICDALRNLEQASLDWLRPWDFGPYRAERCYGFNGRQWLFEKVREWAQNPNADRALLLTSSYGVGKTAFLAKLITDQLSGLPLAAEHFCQAEINDTLSPGRFVSSVAAQLVRSLPSYRLLLQAREASDLRKMLDASAQKPFEAWDQAVVALLHRIPVPRTDYLLVVDALDVALGHRPAAGEADMVKILDLLTRSTKLPTWFRVLVTSRNHQDFTNRMQVRFKHDDKLLIDADRENIKDLHDYVVNRCKTETLFKKISAAGLEPLQVANHLSRFEQSRGKFLYVESMLSALEADLIPLRNIDDLQALPPEMDRFYRLTFEIGFPNSGAYVITRNILGVMCEAMEPLGLIELAAIIGCELGQIRTSLQPLQTLLIQKNSTTENKTLVSFEHVSLTQWLSDVDAKSATPKALPFEVDRTLAKDMINKWAIAEVEKGKAHTWSYLSRHLTSHLNDNDRSEIISNLLTSFDWIQARLEHTSINTLLDDFQIAGINDSDQDSVLKMLQRALGQSEQILRNQSNQLPSQLLARLAPISDKDAQSNSTINVIRKFASESAAVRPVHLAIPLTPSLFKPQLARSISIPIPNKGSTAKPLTKVTSLCISSDRKFVYLGLEDGSLWSWDLSNGEYKSTNIYLDKSVDQPRHEAEVSTIVELKHPDGLIASASRDKKIIIWKRSSLEPIRELEGHEDSINSLLAIRYQNQSFLVSASDDQTLRVWGVGTGVCFITHKYARDDINDDSQIVSLSDLSGTEFISVSTDALVQKWSITSLANELIYKIPSPFETNHLDALIADRPRMKILAANHYDSSLHIVTSFDEDAKTKSYIIDIHRKAAEESKSWASVNIKSFFTINGEHFYYSLKDSPIMYLSLLKHNGDEAQELELGYNESPIDCLALSRDKQGKAQLATSAIKKNTAGDHFAKIALWATDILPNSLQRPHRSPVVWITSFDDHKTFVSFAADGSVYIWDPKKILLLENNWKLENLEPIARFKLYDFNEVHTFTSLRHFVLGKYEFAILKDGGLFLYEIPYFSSAQTDVVETRSFSIYNEARSNYEPVSVIKTNYLGYVFGCIDGRIIYVPQPDKSNSDFYTRQACKNGSVDYLYELNNYQLLCWPSMPSNEEVFSICHFESDKGIDKVTVNSFKIKSDDFGKVNSGHSASNLIRPLRIWNHERNIAISHSNYIVSIWKWNDEKAELDLLHKLEGHTSIVNDLIQLDNGNYVTISEDKTIRSWEYVRDKQMLNGNILFTSDYELKTFAKYEMYERTILVIGDEQGNIHWMDIS
jgi:WD40 repeat protein